MHKLFCSALWMPTVVFNEFDNVDCKESEIFEVSDSLGAAIISRSNDNRLYVSLSINTNHDVVIHFYTDDNYCYNRHDVSLDVKLRHIFHSRGGMFVYSVETLVNDHPVFVDSENGTFRFPCDLYHRIKTYYHEHSFHDGDDGDSVLKPYIEIINNENVENIRIMVENATKHYLELYSRRFSFGYEYLQMDYYSLANCSVFRKLMFFFQAKKHLSFYRMASALRGDRIYMNTLLHSSYNTVMKEKCCSEEANIEDNLWMQKIYNIDNTQKSIGLMIDCIDNKLGITNARISFWIAILAIAISIYLAL